MQYVLFYMHTLSRSFLQLFTLLLNLSFSGWPEYFSSTETGIHGVKVLSKYFC